MSGKLIIFQGLPASGKSTKAADLILRSQMSAEDASQWISRVNQDEIRKELGWTSWGSWDFNSREERRVPGIKADRVRAVLRAGQTVISDDTNINPDTVTKLQTVATECGAAVEILRMNTHLDECIRRDQLRGPGCVGEKVIREMAGKWARVLDPGDQPFFPKVREAGRRKAVVCDLDGTISLFERKGHRGPYDASKCDEDECNQIVRETLHALLHHYEYAPIYLSGRYDTFRPQTETFLRQNGCPDGPLYMRAQGDSRIDWLVKGELFERHVREYYDVKLVLDDRDQVVKFWRGIGLTCFQVADGKF